MREEKKTHNVGSVNSICFFFSFYVFFVHSNQSIDEYSFQFERYFFFNQKLFDNFERKWKTKKKN